MKRPSRSFLMFLIVINISLAEETAFSEVKLADAKENRPMPD